METFQKKLDENLLAVPCAVCDLRFMVLVFTETEFTTGNSRTAWVEPIDQGKASTTLTISARESEAQKSMLPFLMSECIHIFKEEKEEFNKTKATKMLIRKMIINIVEDKYIHDLKHPRTVYQRVEPLFMLTHLWETYGLVDDINTNAKQKGDENPIKLTNHNRNTLLATRTRQKICLQTPEEARKSQKNNYVVGDMTV